MAQSAALERDARPRPDAHDREGRSGARAALGLRQFAVRCADPNEWPADLRVQEMPRVYDNEEARISQPTLL
jgi:hypothetical protein